MRRKLNDGTEIPAVGLGTWKAQGGEVEAAVVHAICTAGYRHVDGAQIYQNQVEVGLGLRSAMEGCGVARAELWVTSKLWMTDFHPDDVPAAVDRILRELGLQYVDQLLLHWPTPFQKPPPGCPPECPPEFAGTDMVERPRNAKGHYVPSNVPLSETWKALERAKAAGKVRSIGVSNFQPEDIDVMTAYENATMPAVDQVEMHVFWNQAALRAELAPRGVALVAYSPLGNPALYGGRAEGMAGSLVASVAAESGLTPAQVMLAFLLSLDAIVVPKSVTPSRIESNIGFQANLTDEQLARLAREAPQSRLANPGNRPGGGLVFNDAPCHAGRLEQGEL